MVGSGALVGARSVLLDAGVPPSVALALGQFGHDVVAAAGDASLEMLEDMELLREATRQQRVLVTFNIADFSEVAGTFAHAQQEHAGIILIHSRSYRRTDIGAIARALDQLLRSRDSFTNTVLYLAHT